MKKLIPAETHILILADGRSPTARRWIATLQTIGFRVSLISTFPCQPPNGLTSCHILPVAFSRFSGGSAAVKSRPQTNSSPPGHMRRLIRRFMPLFQKVRYWIGPITLLRFAWPYQRHIQAIQPDLVHALRIPFEGMLGSYTPAGTPFLAATWGNDLTLHARGAPLMQYFTRRCLRRADGLTSDTHRDVRLAQNWGLDPNAPTLVVPGCGGIDLLAMQARAAFDGQNFELPETGPWVVNPRGLRPGSVHQEIFIAAAAQVLDQRPDTIFICPTLAGKAKIIKQIQDLDIDQRVFLLPKLTQPQLWGLFQQSQLFVSPSSHDGTPNTLLEAMACGCFPVAGNIESLREWITPGQNGLLVNPKDPNALAAAILTGLQDDRLRQKAAVHNLALIKKRAAQSATRPKIEAFYQTVLKQFISDG